ELDLEALVLRILDAAGDVLEVDEESELAFLVHVRLPLRRRVPGAGRTGQARGERRTMRRLIIRRPRLLVESRAWPGPIRSRSCSPTGSAPAPRRTPSRISASWAPPTRPARSACGRSSSGTPGRRGSGSWSPS